MKKLSSDKCETTAEIISTGKGKFTKSGKNCKLYLE